jgi:hypothetical protein
MHSAGVNIQAVTFCHAADPYGDGTASRYWSARQL